jgi:hypothetical protein
MITTNPSRGAPFGIFFAGSGLARKWKAQPYYVPVHVKSSETHQAGESLELGAARIS